MAYEQNKQYEQKPNTGNLWLNRKKEGKQPDHQGDLYLSREFLMDMLSSQKEDLIKVQIASWLYVSKAGNEYQALQVSEPYVKDENKKSSKPAYTPAPTKSSENDDDIPF